MSTLEEHEAEQAEITEACTNGTCEHTFCGMTATEAAQDIMDATEDEPDDNRRRAARALRCYLPSYEEGPKQSLTDFVTDLLHLCDLAGWDFAEIEQDARRNYRSEIGELGVAKDPAFARIIREEE